MRRIADCRTQRARMALAFLAALTGCSFSNIRDARSDEAQILNNDAMRPVMTVNDGEITACGIAIDLTADGQSFELILANEKASAGKVTKLTVRPSSGNTEPAEARIKSASLQTLDHSTADALDVVSDPEDGDFQARAIGKNDAFGSLFQQLLVGGGRVTITSSTKEHVWKITGPAAHSVRQAYLMCAGDLYRP